VPGTAVTVLPTAVCPAIVGVGAVIGETFAIFRTRDPELNPKPDAWKK